VESTQRIGEIRRVDREAPTKQYGEKQKRGDTSGGQPNSPEEPHDIVELTPGSPPAEAPAAPPTQRITAPAPQVPERHIDIKV
jgi:hypothetical protein